MKRIILFLLMSISLMTVKNSFAFTYTKGTTNYSYSTQSQPAKNGTYIDSPFNTTIRRLTNYHTDGVPQGAAVLMAKKTLEKQ